ncbi:alpha-1,3-mannosyl-glycoprotein 4-beta-N-acetylglucosaminyltransferase C-like [Monodelphis domestica]|uniref:Alpha-1,3-mannosyl-glycoprotein 4-beta-N-acetylglucosaminyltransferase C-like n=1 Tax=Monodelphis domestica TaxID=13616 RepID=K7E0M1_MONDO|nr:alpha-1,3-mannosyl-glycoprotein 4-beta-N-acetylglucosaminyltransferase C-like [Monodelphis domestica]XP_016285563.1 alpha-1,3-mannosyl-glycoprotein 4-beta-N-acetylglucosaminyltransferase C-like [Monodelphis domestica]XP_016285565.1 alpha-1,3-mannosyl-glycoprotein 4-beta-N-acetylglucosaminyltransferase C-like [Monodelphis domestica]XP_056671717.1 alpha-1,3-mannosyl-glycoprotein 4-beta-N-acetylglucosaminyltransferase C-like [Monodelphis domestica]
MHYSTQCSALAFLAFIFLGCFFSLGTTTETDENQILLLSNSTKRVPLITDSTRYCLHSAFTPQEEKKLLTWMIAQEQITSVSKSHLKPFKEIQNPFKLSNASYQKAGILLIKNKLLNMGLFMRHSQGNYLMRILKSLFQASSSDKQKSILVLVCLTILDTDIVKIFSPQILKGQLLVIHFFSTVYPPVTALKPSFSEAYPSMVQLNQNVTHVLFMNFADNFSVYFLMMEDNVHCLPTSITCIWRKVVTWEKDDWVLMEFSIWGFAGKFLDSSDFPWLVQFFFLSREASPEVFLYHFQKLLAQNNSIQFSPFFFHQMSFFSKDRSNRLEYKTVTMEIPNNPPAIVYSGLQILNNVSLQKAYIPREKGVFWALEPKVGYHPNEVLAKAATITQVLTGRDQENNEKLKDKKVELYYGAREKLKFCTHHLLGSLVNGKLDYKIWNKKTGNNMSCLNLVESTSQHCRVKTKCINIWSNPEQ